MLKGTWMAPWNGRDRYWWLYYKPSKDTELVGQLCYEVGSHWIYNVKVVETMRGQGYGQKMMAEAVKYLVRKYKVDTLHLTCRTNNGPALHIYKKLGFVIVGTEYDELYRMTWKREQ